MFSEKLENWKKRSRVPLLLYICVGGNLKPQGVIWNRSQITPPPVIWNRFEATGEVIWMGVIWNRYTWENVQKPFILCYDVIVLTIVELPPCTPNIIELLLNLILRASCYDDWIICSLVGNVFQSCSNSCRSSGFSDGMCMPSKKVGCPCIPPGNERCRCSWKVCQTAFRRIPDTGIMAENLHINY